MVKVHAWPRRPSINVRSTRGLAERIYRQYKPGSFGVSILGASVGVCENCMELGNRGAGKRGWIAKSQEMLDCWRELDLHWEQIYSSTATQR